MMEFTITEEEMQEILEASKPVPYMVFGGVEPASPQERVNRVWQKIGKIYKVDWLTIRPVNEAKRLMSGEPKVCVDPQDHGEDCRCLT